VPLAADTPDRPRRGFADWAATALLAAAAQFVVLTVIAMLVYSGGSTFDPSTGGYAFAHNFFSDLGMTETYDGAGNTLAMVLFTYALICVGLALAAFGFAVRRLADATGGPGGGPARGARGTAAAAALAAAVSGVSYVGIACTPHDVAAAAHNQFVNLAFGFLLVFVLCLGSLEVRAGWPRPLVIANFLYAGLLAVYVYLLFWGPSTEYERGLMIQVVAQKVIVYTSILNLGWQALGFRRALRRETSPDADAVLLPEPAAAD
jgi:hypothetical protein